MTQDSDIINGILGIFQALRQMYPELTQISGIPMVDTEAYSQEASRVCQFVTSLAWKTTEAIYARPGFPSWSWAGWRNPDMVEDNFPKIKLGRSPIGGVDDEASCFNVHIQTASDSSTTILDLDSYVAHQHDNSLETPLCIKHIQITAPMTQIEYFWDPEKDEAFIRSEMERLVFR